MRLYPTGRWVCGENWSARAESFMSAPQNMQPAATEVTDMLDSLHTMPKENHRTNKQTNKQLRLVVWGSKTNDVETHPCKTTRIITRNRESPAVGF